MTTVFWVILALILLIVVIYMAGSGQKRKRVITESTQKFPENQATTRSAS